MSSCRPKAQHRGGLLVVASSLLLLVRRIGSAVLVRSRLTHTSEPKSLSEQIARLSCIDAADFRDEGPRSF